MSVALEPTCETRAGALLRADGEIHHHPARVAAQVLGTCAHVVAPRHASMARLFVVVMPANEHAVFVLADSQLAFAHVYQCWTT